MYDLNQSANSDAEQETANNSAIERASRREVSNRAKSTEGALYAGGGLLCTIGGVSWLSSYPHLALIFFIVGALLIITGITLGQLVSKRADEVLVDSIIPNLLASSKSDPVLDIISIVLQGNELIVGLPPQIDVIVKNIGSVPAFNVGISAVTFASPGKTLSTVEKDACAPTNKPKSGVRLGPGDRKRGFSEAEQPITKPLIEQLEIEIQHLFVFVTVSHQKGEEIFRYRWHMKRRTFAVFP